MCAKHSNFEKALSESKNIFLSKLQLYERVGMKIPRQTKNRNSGSHPGISNLRVYCWGIFFVKGKGSACKTGYYQTR